MQGLYFASTCKTSLPVTVPVCTVQSDTTATKTIVQAHLYLDSLNYTTTSDNFDNSPPFSEDGYEVAVSQKMGFPYQWSTSLRTSTLTH